jgi:hypothetical protein
MPLLRRSHDHCRELQERRPTSRFAVPSGRGQDRNAMTFVIASPHPRLPRSLAFRRCLAVTSVPAKAPAASSIRPKSPNRPQRQRQPRYHDHRSRRLRPRMRLQPKPPPVKSP